MALLQIAEPGQSPQPHQRRLAVGIDLGTTNSLVAALRSGLSEPLADADGQVILPSAVRYHADRVEVGESAKLAAATDPLNTVLSVKRLMGRGLSDVKQLGDQLPYRFVGGESHMPFIDTIQGPKSPVEVSADILKVLASACRSHVGRRAGRRGDHCSCLFRRCSASSHQGCGQTGRSECAASAQ